MPKELSRKSILTQLERHVPTKRPNLHWTSDCGRYEYIALTQGKIAKVSIEDYPLIAPFRWIAGKFKNGNAWYACA